MSNKSSTIDVEGVSFPVRQFDEYDLNYADYMVNPKWVFSNAMVGACEPLFDSCDGNYDVEDKLKKAGVIHAKTVTDSEYCSLYVYFSKKQSALKFIEHLNRYLVEKAKKLSAAEAY